MGEPSRFRFNDLPVELQHEVFVVGACEDTSNALRLALVSRKTNKWISPIIYNMITLGSSDMESFMRTLYSKPSIFFATHVKCLCLSVSVDSSDAAGILSICTGVKFLAFWLDYLAVSTEGAFSRLFSPLSLRRLSVEFEHLQNLCLHTFSPQTTIDTDTKWCSDLTHLDIIFWDQVHSEVENLPDLGQLPSLTHVGLWHPHGPIDELVVNRLLESCERLKILLVVVDEHDLVDHPIPSDRRVIFMPYPATVVQDWEASYRGLSSTWSRAEEALLTNMSDKTLAG